MGLPEFHRIPNYSLQSYMTHFRWIGVLSNFRIVHRCALYRLWILRIRAHGTLPRGCRNLHIWRSGRRFHPRIDPKKVRDPGKKEPVFPSVSCKIYINIYIHILYIIYIYYIYILYIYYIYIIYIYSFTILTQINSVTGTTSCTTISRWKS